MEQNRLILEQNQDQEKIENLGRIRTDRSVDPCLTPAISVMMKSNVSSVALLVSAFEPIFFTFEIILKSEQGFQKVLRPKSSYIDVGDGCWRWFMLVTIFIYWINIIGGSIEVLETEFWH